MVGAPPAKIIAGGPMLALHGGVAGHNIGPELPAWCPESLGHRSGLSGDFLTGLFVGGAGKAGDFDKVLVGFNDLAAQLEHPHTTH